MTDNTFTDTRDGQTYQFIEIKGILWMAENLNFETEDSWWYQENEANLIDYGAPVVDKRNLSSKGDKESKSELSGYFLVKAESMDEALTMLRNHPHILAEETCTLEVHEIMSMPEK